MPTRPQNFLGRREHVNLFWGKDWPAQYGVQLSNFPYPSDISLGVRRFGRDMRNARSLEKRSKIYWIWYPSSHFENKEKRKRKEKKNCFTVPAVEYLVPAIEYLQAGSEYLLPDAEYLVPDAEYLVPAAEYLAVPAGNLVVVWVHL